MLSILLLLSIPFTILIEISAPKLIQYEIESDKVSLKRSIECPNHFQIFYVDSKKIKDTYLFYDTYEDVFYNFKNNEHNYKYIVLSETTDTVTKEAVLKAKHYIKQGIKNFYYKNNQYEIYTLKYALHTLIDISWLSEKVDLIKTKNKYSFDKIDFTINKDDKFKLVYNVHNKIYTKNLTINGLYYNGNILSLKDLKNKKYPSDGIIHAINKIYGTDSSFVLASSKDLINESFFDFNGIRYKIETKYETGEINYYISPITN